ncbi:hypothetical protein C0Q70_08312 [Pomacea canaliculata]|uniref:Uncharacterized protein n=2 Tax=Pomacea canaliculata TaxID=400727 RepID=A0A2T7PHG6_POMCA|nr:hypothetical protein C0Q70_08312 [Pomacea canaliculata]
METKLSYRASKKGANGASTTASVKKVKRKKNKVKQTVKGRESKESGIHSPDFDIETRLEGDGTLTDVTDSELSPARKVTRLPLLDSKMSLTTRPSDQACYKLKTSLSMSPPQTLPLSTIPASEKTSVDEVTTRVATMAVKKPQAKSRIRSHIGKSTQAIKSSRNRPKQGDAARQQQQRQQQHEPEEASATFNETLRWEYVVENTEEERERVAAYKVNRRQRYLAAARAKGLQWAVEQAAPSPQSEDSGVETACASPGSFAVYRTMPRMRVVQKQKALAETLVKC